MFEFEKVCEIMNIEQRVSKNGNAYIVVRVLSDNGSTVDVVYKSDSPFNFSDVKLRGFSKCTFVLNASSQYRSLNIVNIAPVEIDAW